MRACEDLDAMDARIPWIDPLNPLKGGLNRVVSMISVPRGPDFMDDEIKFLVDLPPGSGPGPVVPPSLRQWGVQSGPAYSALLNLAYRWWVPGITRIPARGGLALSPSE